MAEKPIRPNQPFGTLAPYEPSLLEGLGSRLQDLLVENTGMSRPQARKISGTVGLGRTQDAPLLRATDILGGPAGVGVALGDFQDDPGFVTGAGVGLAAIPVVGGPAGRGLKAAVEAAREARKAPARERARIKPEARNVIKDEEYITSEDNPLGRMVDEGGIATVSKVRQEIESIGMGQGAWSKQKVIKELNKRGVTNDQMEASGILALLDRKPNVTKEELVAQHERFAPELVVEARMGEGVRFPDDQRISEIATDAGVEPLDTFNYTETIFRNKNPELGGDKYKTTNSHGLGGSARGEIGHARTSEYMLPGTGRVELIEEIQSDLYKLVKANQDAGTPAKKKQSLSVALTNNRNYFDALTKVQPRVENDILDIITESGDVLPEAVVTRLRKLSREFKTNVARFEDSIKNLDHVNRNSSATEDGLALATPAFDRMRVANSEASMSISSLDNDLFDLVNTLDKAGLSDLSTKAATLRKEVTDQTTLFPISNRPPLMLAMGDAGRANNISENMLRARINPIVSPRAVERAETAEFQKLYTEYDDIARKSRMADRDAKRAKAMITEQEARIRNLTDDISLYDDRAATGVTHASFDATGATMQMRERILKGDQINKAKAEERIKNSKEIIKKLTREYDTKLEESVALTSKAGQLRKRMGTNEEDKVAFQILESRNDRPVPTREQVNPAMPFASLNDTTQFMYETMIERALNNPNLKGVVLPDYRDIANKAGARTAEENFRIGYEEAPKAVLKRLKKRYPDIEITTTKIPGSDKPATLVKFPDNMVKEEPLIQGYAQGGMVYKGIGSMGREVL